MESLALVETCSGGGLLWWRELLGWGLAPMGRFAPMGGVGPAGFWCKHAFGIGLLKYGRNVASIISRFMAAGHPAEQNRCKTAMLERSISGDAIKYPCAVGGFLTLKINDFKKQNRPEPAFWSNMF